MTLNDLIRKANNLAMQLSSGDVPLVTEDTIIDDITFDFHNENDESYIRINIW